MNLCTKNMSTTSDLSDYSDLSAFDAVHCCSDFIFSF